MKNKETPLLRQYNQIKKQYPDTVLFFRLGDFFETFNEDAKITASVCGITLTKRNNGAAGDMPLAGFPHHQIDTYLPKMIKAGHRVAVCDQLEDPKMARGIVKRGVTEVVTPGVALYDKLLDAKANNYIAAVVLGKKSSRGQLAGFAFADITTGEFYATEFNIFDLPDILSAVAPSELLINREQKNQVLPFVEKLEEQPSVTKLETWIFDFEFGRDALLAQFSTKSLKGFGIEGMEQGIAAAGAILSYINDTQKTKLSHLSSVSAYNPGEFMTLDPATRRNLEITMSTGDFGPKAAKASLVSILDKTLTPMGGRLLRKWVARPLRSIGRIHARLEATDELFRKQAKQKKLRETLQSIGDMERLISKICTGRANPRDLIYMLNSLQQVPFIKQTVGSSKCPSLAAIANNLDELTELVTQISTSLIDEPSVQLGTGNVFRKGYDEELDDYINAKSSAKEWMNDFRDRERERTGIQKLKVSFNNVFGYYIEITKTHKDKVPDDYERKQTLTNSERYITQELKEFEIKILSAEERISEIEQRLFAELRMDVAEYSRQIQQTAAGIARLDCLQSFAEASKEYNYSKPLIDESDVLEIKLGRHPVVERLLDIGQTFTANDTSMNCSKEQLHILTGPNMSGKSCYLRQVALVVLLGQIGCFVPAKSARFGVVDRIFTRVGAQDNISSGESTFLVEMQEAANIMNNATKASLILLDEVGRGTATFDGISIAWAIAEYLHDELGAKTLFATHYHELNDLADRYDKIQNYKVEVIEAGETVIFTHKVLHGASDHSFGIHVAQMAGMPEAVTKRAEVIMRSFEKQQIAGDSPAPKSKVADTSAIQSKPRREIPEQMSIFEFRDDTLREQILRLDVNNITPMEALKILSAMHKEVTKGQKKAGSNGR